MVATALVFEHLNKTKIIGKKVNAFSQKMKYVKFNTFQLELMGKLEWDFFGTEEVSIN